MDEPQQPSAAAPDAPKEQVRRKSIVDIGSQVFGLPALMNQAADRFIGRAGPGLMTLMSLVMSVVVGVSLATTSGVVSVATGQSHGSVDLISVVLLLGLLLATTMQFLVFLVWAWLRHQERKFGRLKKGIVEAFLDPIGELVYVNRSR
jgi:hypothetical protein